MGVHQVPKNNVQVHFTESSFDPLVKKPNSKSYFMIVNNLLKSISVEVSSNEIKMDEIHILRRKKAENTKWNYWLSLKKNAKERKGLILYRNRSQWRVNECSKENLQNGDDECTELLIKPGWNWETTWKRQNFGTLKSIWELWCRNSIVTIREHGKLHI